MRKILGFLIVFLPLNFLSCSKSHNLPLVIKNVYDGDTIYFQNKQLGRIFGIDTPEFKDSHGNKTIGIQYQMALQAKQKLRSLLQNQVVRIIKINTDSYNRLIVKLQTNRFDVGIAMVRQGMARVAYISNKKKAKFFSPDENYYKKLLEAQHYAYTNQYGIWDRKDLYKTIFPKKV